MYTRLLPRYRRLLWAFALSFGMHIGVLFPIHWPFGIIEPITGQIVLQARLQQIQGKAPDSAEKSSPTKSAQKTIRSLGRPKNSTGIVAEHGSRYPPPPPESDESADAREQERQALVVQQAIPPEYPAEALQRKLEGCVLASVTVSEAGEVAHVDILETDHPGVFDQSVIDSQMAARYLPARKEGSPTESRVLAVAAFVMEPGKRLNCALKYATIATKLVGGIAP